MYLCRKLAWATAFGSDEQTLFLLLLCFSSIRKVSLLDNVSHKNFVEEIINMAQNELESAGGEDGKEVLAYLVAAWEA